MIPPRKKVSSENATNIDTMLQLFSPGALASFNVDISIAGQFAKRGCFLKRLMYLLGIIMMILMTFGCTTIYTASVDERNVKTIYQDTEIKTVIVKRFYDDESIKTLDISVACYNGHVFLIGEYEKPIQRTNAIKIANGIEGVKSVTQYILPKKKDPACGTTKNLELTANVKAKLIQDKNIWSTNVDVKTIQCIVVLYGLVGSKTEINKVISHAKSVEGVRSVKSFLKSK